MPITWWGVLGPEKLIASRRSNTLGLGSTIRMFNELAVPGLGGLFFGKQILPSLLGIEAATRLREKGHRATNIEVANALESAGCWLGYQENGWQPERRLRGQQKLRNRTADDFTFKKARQRSFYVTQQMRMGVVQTLPALGFVCQEGGRFNQFSLSETGRDFLLAATAGLRPCHKEPGNYIFDWCSKPGLILAENSPALASILSPLIPFPEKAKKILTNKLLKGSVDGEENMARRRGIWVWVGKLVEKVPGWESRPAEIGVRHWEDLKAGAYFQNLRSAAVDLLQSIENSVAQKRNHALEISGEEIRSLDLTSLNEKARLYLDLAYDCPEAAEFAQECALPDPGRVAQNLASRDGTGIALAGGRIVPGTAFRGLAPMNAADDEPEGENASGFPPGISHRVSNMKYLREDIALARQEGQ